MGKFALLVLKRASSKFMKDGCLLKAQALAYTTLFSVVPVSVVSFSLLSQFKAFAKWEDAIRNFLFQNLLPTSSQRLEGYIAQFTEKATALGIFGLIGSIITAVFLLDTIERTFNEIWSLRRRRPFIPRFISFWSFLTLVPLLLGASIYTSSVFSRYVRIENIYWLSKIFWLLLPYTFAVLAFFSAYRFLPYAETSSKASIVAALVMAPLWELSKWSFDWYVTYVVRISRVYGSLGLFPIFLIWLYIVWVIVLYGAEMSYVIQFPKGKKGGGTCAVLHVLYTVAKRFRDGLPSLSVTALAEETGLYREDLEAIIEALEKKGWFLSANGGVSLSFSPDKMPLQEAIKIAGNLSFIKTKAEEDIPNNVKKVVNNLRGKVLKEVESYTLRDLVEEKLDSKEETV